MKLPAVFAFMRWAVLFLAIIAVPRLAIANGCDLPPEVALRGFIKAEDGRLRLLLRVPLALLSSFGLPKRGPGYLDLARIDEKLKQAAAAAGKQIELREDGVPLAPVVRRARISLLSDRSFERYDAALARLEGPPLAVDTDLFWNQGFFDAELEYPLPSPSARVSIRMNVAPELGRRLKLQLEFLPAGQSPRSFAIPAGAGWIALDPSWYEAAWLFLKTGFLGGFALDRFAFLLCLLAPFRQFRGLLAIVVVLTALQALTLTASALGAVDGVRWLPQLFDTSVAAAIVLLAVGNLAAPSLRRRALVSAVIGVLGGFSLGGLLAGASQFAGTHSLVATASFNVGIAMGEIVSLALAYAAVRWLLDRVLAPALGAVVLSAVLGHMAWHWMVERGHAFSHEVEHAAASGLSSALAVAGLWLIPALVVGAIAWFLPRRFNGAPVPSLLAGLLARNAPGSLPRD